ncbi:MAG: large subunit ribosomal protein L15 [Parcubacteria group bacterium Gr01-1014_38]|nr:MAG: large subunit ribosomal protein L15 [Parcubacteria group bacterium Gr01-1014_38]
MQVHQWKVPRKRRKRIGRGIGSRRGTYSTRGVKGQKARAGARIRAGFEGGQTPLYARLPKRRGFRSPWQKAAVVNLEDLERHFPAGAMITRAGLATAGLIRRDARRVKVLGDGVVSKALTVQVPVSASAKKKIEGAGGTVTVAENA